MSKQAIEFYTTEWSSVVDILPDAYEYRPERGWRWLQYICLFLLNRIGAFYCQRRSVANRHVLHCQTMMERLYKQHREVLQSVGRAPTRLIIGSDDYKELMRDTVAVTGYINLSGATTEVMGMKIEIVPWISGVVALP